MTKIIRTKDLSYTFPGGVRTLNCINLEIEQGQIYGFLGPNGSGKTTTLRLLLGLLSVQVGTVKIFGKDIRDSRIDILKRTGSLIETPSLYGHLDARDNLNIYRSIYGVTKDRVEAVLEIVNLANTGKKVTKNFSLGMKQRLAIALALLPNPELLILDEPTNGLDPEGIMELRELILTLNRLHGQTILISSHILSEVEKIVTHVGVISNGNLLFQGTLADLRQLSKDEKKLTLNTSDNKAASHILQHFSPSTDGDTLVMRYKDQQEIGLINQKLVENNIMVYQLQPEQNGLEQLYRNLTAKRS